MENAPTIFRSTSTKLQVAESDSQSDEVVQASADESLSQITIPPELVQMDVEVEEPIETESLDIPLSEVLGESLINIEIPKGPLQEDVIQEIATQEVVTEDLRQRLPELVKRSPAMQLHIGGGPSTTTDSEKGSSGSANFSLSDSDESGSATKVMKYSSAKTMNVRIEGEPVISQAPVVSQHSKVAPSPIVVEAQAATHVAAQTPVATQVAAQPTAMPESATATQKPPLFDPTAQNAGQKSLSDKVADRPTTIGERLEVGLHEAVNVDTPQPISGLSVEHPEYCQVLKSSDRSLSFVGLKAGQTRVALFTTSASGERKIEIREVVIAGAETRQADMKSLATEISRSVHRMYPNSRIEVIAEDEGLTVQGYAGSEEEAKKIIGLVRRTSLQPVVDRLATYK